MEKHNNRQSRKYIIKLQNIEQVRLDPRLLRILLQEFRSLEYYCYSYGVAEDYDTATFIYVEFTSPVRIITLMDNMPSCHISQVCGSTEENRTRINSYCEEYGYVECERFEKRILHPEVLNI